MILSEKNYQRIHAYLASNGVSNRRLRDELSDHLASLTEDIMRREGVLFDAAFQQARQQVCPHGPHTIQRDLFLSTLKQYIKMRKSQFIIGYLAVALVLIGYTFKTLHFPTAGIQIFLGSVLFSLVFVPMFWYNRYKLDRLKGKSRPTWRYFLNALTLLLYSLGVLFKIMHWPNGSLLFVTGTALLVLYYLPQLFYNLYQQNLKEARA